MSVLIGAFVGACSAVMLMPFAFIIFDCIFRFQKTKKKPTQAGSVPKSADEKHLIYYFTISDNSCQDEVTNGAFYMS